MISAEEFKAIERYMTYHDLFSFAPAAALIDMDGTLYDSMPRHARAWHTMMKEIGVECDEKEFFMYEGRTGADTINLLLRRSKGREASSDEAAELYRRKTEIFASLPRVEVMPGAQRMVDTFLKAGITTVLVTGSGQATLLNRLEEEFPGAFPPERRVTSRDVVKGKPHPEPFLRAMRIAGVTPENAIAVDNAPIGVRAAAASGAFTIGVVTGPIEADALYEAGADIVYPSMEALADALPGLINQFNFSI